MGLQLWHEGPYRNPKKSEHPDVPSWSASGFKVPDKVLWPAMTDAEIATAIDEFVEAAVTTKELGFDCVEFHGAHSYLLDSFFWSETNKREDRWGGDWTGRTRIACEIIRGTRQRVGDDFPLIIRLSQWKQQDFAALSAQTPMPWRHGFLRWSMPGIDMFHCSQRRFWEPTFDGSDLNFAGWAKK